MYQLLEVLLLLPIEVFNGSYAVPIITFCLWLLFIRFFLLAYTNKKTFFQNRDRDKTGPYLLTVVVEAAFSFICGSL